MIDINIKSAGSNPASSTKHRTGLEPPRPAHPSISKASSDSSPDSLWVSDGQQGSPKCPESVTECLGSVTYAQRIIEGIGPRDFQRFNQNRLNDIAYLSSPVAHEYVRVAKKKDYLAAHMFLSQIYEEIHLSNLNLTDDINQIKLFAAQKARDCLLKSSATTLSLTAAYCKAKLERYQIHVDSRLSDEELIALCKDERFWFKKFKSKQSKVLEQIRRKIGLVNQYRGAYCSQQSVDAYNWSQQQVKDYMAKQFFVNASGEMISMLDAYQSNVSNPANRRAELMIRIKGVEEFSEMNSHSAWFYTITAPSKYHSHFKSGKPNPKYAGASASETHQYLQKQWEKARAQFKRESIDVYGLRVVEPHHDGTPHWHLMLFMPSASAKRVTQILRHYSLEHEPNESGAKRNRFKAKEIDSDKGSAQSYIAKYVCKNIDGEFLDTDKYGNDAKRAANRITAWAAIFKIRQFQFMGTPSVTLYRELRKLKVSDVAEHLRPIAEAADSGDWFTYMLLMNGTCKNSERPFKLEYERQLKKHLKGIEVSGLSELAYSRKPKAITSALASFQLPTSDWTLLSAPSDQNALVAAWGDEVVFDSGGPPRERKGAPFGWGKAPLSGDALDLCK